MEVINNILTVLLGIVTIVMACLSIYFIIDIIKFMKNEEL